MLGTNFDHGTLRKYSAIFGSLFNNISINRYESNGTVSKIIKCPINFAPKEHFFMSLRNADKSTSTSLPRLSFEMTGVRYDASRKTNSIQTISTDSATENSKTVQYNRVPYEVGFQLNIAVKNIEDGLQIIEQIIPFFTPHFTVALKDNVDIGLTNDVTIKLDDMDTSIEYEGDVATQRAIIWTMNFTLVGFIYSPTRDVGIIKEYIININEDTILRDSIITIDTVTAGDGTRITWSDRTTIEWSN